eukprot:scaffold48_cov311-Pinguiococcus_pyrenoidosus.AAC.336
MKRSDHPLLASKHPLRPSSERLQAAERRRAKLQFERCCHAEDAAQQTDKKLKAAKKSRATNEASLKHRISKSREASTESARRRRLRRNVEEAETRVRALKRILKQQQQAAARRTWSIYRARLRAQGYVEEGRSPYF